MLSTCSLMVGSLSPDCLSQVSNPSRIGWFASSIAWTRCSYVSAWSASVMEPLPFRSAVLLPSVSPFRQDRLAILEKNHPPTLLSAAKGHSMEALFVLALTTGMRRGELLALKWQDIDFTQSILQVRRIFTRAKGQRYVESEPKTE